MSISNLEGEILLRHIEQYLGSPSRVWRHNADGGDLPAQVLLFSHQPAEGTGCLLTFGLSTHQLITRGGSPIRTELVICARDSFDNRSIAALLLSVASNAIETHTFPGIHEVLVGKGPVLSNDSFEHFYLTYPGYFSKEFEVCSELTPPVTFSQLIPVSSSEYALLVQRGWKFLEAQFEAREVDLLDFDRRAQVA